MQTPSAKVIVATLMAFIGALALAVVDDGVPADLEGWLQLIAKAIALSGAVGGASYAKTETNPARSQLG